MALLLFHMRQNGTYNPTSINNDNESVKHFTPQEMFATFDHLKSKKGPRFDKITE